MPGLFFWCLRCFCLVPFDPVRYLSDFLFPSGDVAVSYRPIPASLSPGSSGFCFVRPLTLCGPCG